MSATSNAADNREGGVMQDWEPRALPSEARCRVWAEKGGTWHGPFPGSSGFQEIRDVTGLFGAERAFEADIKGWRPWKDNNPAPWSAFMSATHPPIPEGWEAVGEWVCIAPKMVLAEDAVWFHEGGEMWTSAVAICGWSVPVRRALPATPEGWEQVGEWHDTHAPCSEVYDGTLLLDGRIVMNGERFRGSDARVMGLHVRRVPPPADWGDVPKGVTLRPAHGPGGPSNGVFLNGAYVGRVFDVVDAGHYVHSAAQPPVAGSPFASLPAAIVALTGRREKA